MNYFIKKSIIIILIFFSITCENFIFRGKGSYKKNNNRSRTKKRLLIPSIENKNEKIKLIPPKSIKKSKEI